MGDPDTTFILIRQIFWRLKRFLIAGQQSVTSLLLQTKLIIAELLKLGPDLPKTSRTEQRAVLVVVKGLLP